jgi:hypothetical protein
VNAPPEREENLSLDAMISALRDGEPTDGGPHDAVLLELFERAKHNGASWDLIGKALGMDAKEAKRHHKQLVAKVGRARWEAERRTERDRGEEETG